jgi:hypothetical protein
VVVAPPGIAAGEWDEVVLGPRADAFTEKAAATAGLLAARLGGLLRIVVVQPERRSTGWRVYDGIRRLTGAAETAGGQDVSAVESEVRAGRATEQLLSAVRERDRSVVVVAADPPPRWFDVLRPAFTAELLHDCRELVVVVPAAEALMEAPQARRRHATVAGR